MLLLPVSTLILAMALYYPPPHPQAASGSHFWASLGKRAFISGDMRQAAPLLSLAAAAQGLAPEDWIMLGDAYQANGDLLNALQAWQNGGAAVESLQRWLKAHRQSGDYPAAMADLQALIALQPGEAGWAYQLGLLQAATQPDLAVSTLGLAVIRASVHQTLAQALLERIQKAQQAALPAYTLLEAGRGLADLDEWTLAAEAFRRAALLRPDYAEAWAFLGEAQQHIDLPEGKKFSPVGLDELKLSLQLEPDSLSASLFLALYWRRQGQLSLALAALENLAAPNADNPAIQIELGNILAEKGSPKAAMSHFTRATELAPTDPAALKALVNFTVRSQYQVRLAGLSAARQLLLLTPSDPEALDLMGQALLLLEDPLDAEGFLRRAIQSDPGYIPAHLHLAQVYLQRSATASARQELDLTIFLAPGSAEADFARRLLEEYFP
jgi:tetratricopeptide (TPR) repeat protein